MTGACGPYNLGGFATLAPLPLDVIFKFRCLSFRTLVFGYCNNVLFEKLICMKWTCIVTRSHYWILRKNVDLLGSPLGCAQRIPPL